MIQYHPQHEVYHHHLLAGIETQLVKTDRFNLGMNKSTVHVL